MRIAIRLGFIALFFLLLVTVIAYARGYRWDFKGKSLVPTGIIAVSSSPKAAKVYVNGQLKGVTDLSLTLPPDNYTIEVKKEGYTDWKKTIKLKGELVISLDTTLFPRNPSLSPVTNIGIVKAVPIDQVDRLVLFSENGDPEKDGIYVFDASKKPLSFFPPLKLIALKSSLPADISFKDVIVTFSPDSQQGIFEFPTETASYAYLFSLGENNVEPFDISASKDTLLEAWKTEKNKEVAKILETFPKDLRPIAADAFSIIGFSPDGTKVLYQAKDNTTLPAVITPPLIAANQEPEERSIIKDRFYIYDKKEDKNFRIDLSGANFSALTPTITNRQKTANRLVIPTNTPTPAPASLAEETFPLLWYADSRHVIVEREKEIIIMDYDGSNKQTIYSGPFEKNFFTTTSDGKLFILTNLNPQNNQYPDLYEVGIR